MLFINHVSLCAPNKKTQKTAHSQATDQTQAHEAARRLSLLRFDPFRSAHHASAPYVSVRRSEKHLHNDQIEHIAPDHRTFTVDIAKLVQGYEDYP